MTVLEKEGLKQIPQPVYFKIINESTGFVVEVFLSLMPLKEGHDLWCETANETESKEEQ